MNRVEIRYKIDQAYSSMNKYKTLIYSGIVVRAYGDPVFGSNGTPATGGVYFDGEGTFISGE